MILKITKYPTIKFCPTCGQFVRNGIKKQEDCKMKVSNLIRKVAIEEGLKKSISIAQVSEVFRIINKISNGAFYKLIRSL